MHKVTEPIRVEIATIWSQLQGRQSFLGKLHLPAALVWLSSTWVLKLDVLSFTS